MLSTFLSKDGKTWVHILLTLIAAAVGVAAVRPVTELVVVQDGAGVLAGIGVYIATNSDTGFWKYLKGYLSAAGTGLSALAVVLAMTTTHQLGSVTPANWLIVGVQVLASLGVIAQGELKDFDPASVIDTTSTPAGEVPVVTNLAAPADFDSVVAGTTAPLTSDGATATPAAAPAGFDSTATS